MDFITSITSLLSSGWLIAVLCAGIMFATGVHIDERLLKDQKIGTLVIISSLFGFVLMAVFGGVAYCNGTNLFLNQYDTSASILTGVGEMAWVIPYLYALQRRGAIIAGPMFQLIPVIGGIAEYFLGIIPPEMHIVGALLIVAGGFVLAIEEEAQEDGSVKYVPDWKTVLLMATAAGIEALVYVFFKDTANGGAGYVATGFWSAVGMVLTGFIIWLVYKPYRDDFNAFRRNADGKMVGLQVFNECMDVGGTYLTHLANVWGPSVLVVTAFNAAQPIFILIIAAVATLIGKSLGEYETKWRIAIPAIFAIAAGTVLVAL